nr:basic proline-rich protein-like [Pan paniscus]
MKGAPQRVEPPRWVIYRGGAPQLPGPPSPRGARAAPTSPNRPSGWNKGALCAGPRPRHREPGGRRPNPPDPRGARRGPRAQRSPGGEEKSPRPSPAPRPPPLGPARPTRARRPSPGRRPLAGLGARSRVAGTGALGHGAHLQRRPREAAPRQTRARGVRTRGRAHLYARGPRRVTEGGAHRLPPGPHPAPPPSWPRRGRAPSFHLGPTLAVWLGLSPAQRRSSWGGPAGPGSAGVKRPRARVREPSPRRSPGPRPPSRTRLGAPPGPARPSSSALVEATGAPGGPKSATCAESSGLASRDFAARGTWISPESPSQLWQLRNLHSGSPAPGRACCPQGAVKGWADGGAVGGGAQTERGRIWVGEVSLQSLEAEAGPHCSETPCLGSSERSRQGPGALGTVRHANQEGARFPFPGRKASSLSSSPPTR